MVKLFRKNFNLCDHNPPTLQTYGRTDRVTICDGNTALCTKVHRAVIKSTAFVVQYVVRSTKGEGAWENRAVPGMAGDVGVFPIRRN